MYLPEKNYDKIAVYGEFSESSGMDMYVGCQLTKIKIKQYAYPQNGNSSRHFFVGSATVYIYILRLYSRK